MRCEPWICGFDDSSTEERNCIYRHGGDTRQQLLANTQMINQRIRKVCRGLSKRGGSSAKVGDGSRLREALRATSRRCQNLRCHLRLVACLHKCSITQCCPPPTLPPYSPPLSGQCRFFHYDPPSFPPIVCRDLSTSIV